MGSSHRDSKKHAHKSEKEREKDHKSRDRGEGKERKERKSHKEHKSDRDHKSHKEKKEHKKHKRERDHRGDKARVAAPIGPDDFFLKNQEFRAWLWLTQRRRFEDLSSAEAHVEFAQRFCAQFNEGALDTFFYTGALPLELRKTSTSTSHQWSFSLSAQEKDKLSDLAEDVDHQTQLPEGLVRGER